LKKKKKHPHRPPAQRTMSSPSAGDKGDEDASIINISDAVQEAMDLYVQKRPELAAFEKEVKTRRKVVNDAKKQITTFMKKNNVPRMQVGKETFELNTKSVTKVNKERLEKTSTIPHAAKEAFYRENTVEEQKVAVR
jgi:hypothetical protein